MTLPKAFYEGVIYATAEKNPEINDLSKSPTTTEDRYESAKPYIHATKQVLTILKNEPESNWDLRSIQQKLEFLQNRELDDSEIQLILLSLINVTYLSINILMTLNRPFIINYRIVSKKKHGLTLCLKPF